MNSLFFFFVQISLPKSVGSLSGRLLVLCLLFFIAVHFAPGCRLQLRIYNLYLVQKAYSAASNASEKENTKSINNR